MSVSTFLTGICYSQDTLFDDLYMAIENGNSDKIQQELQSIDTSLIKPYDKATWLYHYADFEFSRDNHHLAYEAIMKSNSIFNTLKEFDDLIDCYILELAILSHQNNLKYDPRETIKKLEDLALQKKDTNAIRATFTNIAISFMDIDRAEEAISYFRKTIPLALSLKDSVREGHAYANIAIVHNTINNNLDSALYYNEKAKSILEHFNDHQSLAYNYNNLADIHKQLNDCDLASKYFLKADSISFKDNIAKSKIIFYENMSSLYLECNDYKNASLYFDKLIKLKDSINEFDQNVAIEQLNNEKLRANNLESEANAKKKQNLVYGLLGILALGSIIAFLLFKNTKRKQKLAEQDKELETQKLTTVLKEQELKSIDAMIEGQEKERQRIANDLHDDLGGLMATVKLHFNALKDKQTPELYDKTNQLIDEAYDKVRTVAHAKNSGVIAKQGLLKAINDMAENISASNKIKIDVIDHGLENRLENSLELTIFRIIQELITNIIKHASATEATIHITNHEDSLNIMVEDNGIGFNPSQVTKTNKGMGISSIDKRIEHLEGSMTIESEKKQGTTIIIDIPL
ncbi:sensor histidine kinase [uncultured Psychroserpens sp.]|uniref:tetratricopeptide repeat-containing sensor histidine kinase n=1 Tax=uncultured Psychroserpens sp. TaxID=255436 RepID=UPI002605B17A|nr:sensor histidine kinase [uncultured Psychroserpens sp.]